jgi:hypothetical protein
LIYHKNWIKAGCNAMRLFEEENGIYPTRVVEPGNHSLTTQQIIEQYVARPSCCDTTASSLDPAFTTMRSAGFAAASEPGMS